MVNTEEDGLPRLIDAIEEASKIPAKRRQTPIKPTIEKLTTHLYTHGASPDSLLRLADLLTLRNHLDQASLAAITRNLYPSSTVSDEVVLRFIGALGHGQLKPTLALQALFLRWLVMVYHLLENPGVLGQVYGVLFDLLDTAAIRPQLCHLLALVTRRKHVRPFRIQAILTLSRQTGGDPNLTGLLRVFKNYYPEIIVGDATKGRASAFKHPDPQWRQHLDEIQQRRSEAQEDGVRNGFSVNHALGRRLRGTKAVLPTVHTFHAQENSITLEEIDNAEAFVKNLEKFELPTQLVAVLADPLLQKLLLLRPSAEASSRISSWLMACLGDVVSGDADIELLLDMVEVIRDYVIATKGFPPLLLTFFEQFLHIWDGLTKRDLVLETLSYIPLIDFDDLSPLLNLLETTLLDNTPSSQLSLLTFYHRLLLHWTTLLLSSPDPGQYPAGTSIPQLISHVNKLALTLSQTSPTVHTHLSILDFYASCANLYSNPALLSHISITIPHPLLVYNLYFSPSLAVVSRLCGILAMYKRAWEAVMASPSSSSSGSGSTVKRQLTKHERAQVNDFNGFLMDLCNCLWRGRAFTTTDLNARGCLLPQSVQTVLEKYVRAVDSEMSLAVVFGLSYAPTLCLQAISFMRELEDEDESVQARHAGPVTQASLARLARRGGLELSWQDYRVGVLEYLEAKGFGGIKELMYNTMKNLMKERRT